MQLVLVLIVSALLALFGNVRSEITTHLCTPDEQEQLLVAVTDAQRMVELVLDWEVLNTTQIRRLTWSDLQTLQKRYFGETTAEEKKMVGSMIILLTDSITANVTNRLAAIFYRIHTHWSLPTYHCIHEDDYWYDHCQSEPAAAFAHWSNSTISFCPAFFPSHQYFDVRRALQASKTRQTYPDDTHWQTPSYVIVHEMAHLEQVDGQYVADVPVRWLSQVDHRMDAIAYGAERAQYLAYHSPKAAILNADNYATYASAISIGSQLGLPAAQQIDRTETRRLATLAQHFARPAVAGTLEGTNTEGFESAGG